MLDLSQLYLIDLENDRGEIEKTPCRIISYNETTQEYVISARGVGDTIKTTAGKLYSQDPTVVSGTLNIGNDGNYNVETYAVVEVNVNSETGPLVISTYANDIDTTHYASVDTTALEPTGSYGTVTENNTYNVAGKASITVSVPQPTAGTYNYTSNGDYTDIFTGVVVHVDVPQVTPTLNTITLDANSDLGGLFNDDTDTRKAYGVQGDTFNNYGNVHNPGNMEGYNFVGWSDLDNKQTDISTLPDVYYTLTGTEENALPYSSLTPTQSMILYAVFQG